MTDHAPLPPPEQLLAGAAPSSARHICRHLVHSANEALKGVDAADERGRDSRHELRVALRQLRVALADYAPALDDLVSGKVIRRIRLLARDVGRVRDTDVQSTLLQAVLQRRSPIQRTAIDRLAIPVTDSADTVPLKTASFRHRWQRIARPLQAGLRSWHELRELDAPPRFEPFALLAAGALTAAADRIDRRCAAVTGPHDIAALHRTRLAVKSARYLLKPLARETDGSRTLMHELRDAQATLGALHDAHQLQTAIRARVAEIEGEGTALSRSERTAISACDWDLDTQVATHFSALRNFLDPDRRAERRRQLSVIADAWRTQNAPPLEIERKWLLSALPPRVRSLTPALLRQGYLPGDELVERIRSVTRAKHTEWIRTVKLGRGIVRIEIEEAATPVLGKALYALTAGKRVTKRRYAVHDGPLTWEIDEFTDRTLVLAEVELPTRDTVVALPVWLEPYVVREVTDDREFTNWQLAR